MKKDPIKKLVRQSQRQTIIVTHMRSRLKCEPHLIKKKNGGLEFPADSLNDIINSKSNSIMKNKNKTKD
jgi:hypothetical protein